MDTFPDDYMVPEAFHEQHPLLHRGMNALRWELRHRHVNGLLHDDVVLERFSSPDKSRPSLLISPSRYFNRLKKLSRAAARDAVA